MVAPLIPPMSPTVITAANGTHIVYVPVPVPMATGGLSPTVATGSSNTSTSVAEELLVERALRMSLEEAYHSNNNSNNNSRNSSRSRYSTRPSSSYNAVSNNTIFTMMLLKKMCCC